MFLWNLKILEYVHKYFKAILSNSTKKILYWGKGGGDMVLQSLFMFQNIHWDITRINIDFIKSNFNH